MGRLRALEREEERPVEDFLEVFGRAEAGGRARGGVEHRVGDRFRRRRLQEIARERGDFGGFLAL